MRKLKKRLLRGIGKLVNVFKGLGHAILGNFSTEQMVTKLTKTSKQRLKTIEELRKAKKGHGWTKLERIKMDYIKVNLKNVGSPVFKFISVYIKMSFTQLENHFQLLCDCDFANKRLCQPSSS